MYEITIVGSYLRVNDLACCGLPTISNLPGRRKLYSNPSSHEYRNVQYVKLIYFSPHGCCRFFSLHPTRRQIFEIRVKISHFPGVGCDTGTCIYLMFLFVRRTVLVEQGGAGELTAVLRS